MKEPEKLGTPSLVTDGNPYGSLIIAMNEVSNGYPDGTVCYCYSDSQLTELIAKCDDFENIPYYLVKEDGNFVWIPAYGTLYVIARCEGYLDSDVAVFSVD